MNTNSQKVEVDFLKVNLKAKLKFQERFNYFCNNNNNKLLQGNV